MGNHRMLVALFNLRARRGVFDYGVLSFAIAVISVSRCFDNLY